LEEELEEEEEEELEEEEEEEEEEGKELEGEEVERSLIKDLYTLPKCSVLAPRVSIANESTN